MSWVEILAKEAKKTPQSSCIQTLLEVYDLDEYDPKDQKDFLALSAVSAGELQDLLRGEIVRVVGSPEPTHAVISKMWDGAYNPIILVRQLPTKHWLLNRAWANPPFDIVSIDRQIKTVSWSAYLEAEDVVLSTLGVKLGETEPLQLSVYHGQGYQRSRWWIPQYPGLSLVMTTESYGLLTAGSPKTSAGTNNPIRQVLTLTNNYPNPFEAPLI